MLGAAAVLVPGRLIAGAPRRAGRGCVVEVVRRECFRDLQCRYCENPEAGRCEQFRVGERFELDARDVAAGDGGALGTRCRKAWMAVKGSVDDALGQAADSSCNKSLGECVVVSCPDGTRPVIFKVTFV